MANLFTNTAIASLNSYNTDYNTSYTFGHNWDSTSSMFETYVNKYLFPKMNESVIVNVALGNRFDRFAKEIDVIGQYSEEYVILDSVPVALNLSKNEELMLKRNYPNIATKLYGTGIVKKQKFTLNNNDVRLNFLTFGDAVKYALSVYKKKISDINVVEEMEIKAMLLDYALNVTKNVRSANTYESVFNHVFEAILNIRNNSSKYNESNLASGGSLARYTTQTQIEDICILTSDSLKSYLLNTKIANTFQIQGLDITKHIISFDDLGGVYKTTSDITIADQDTITAFKNYNDYQISIGDVIPKDSVITFDVTSLKEFKTNVNEVKPKTDYFAYVFDVNKLRYRRCTRDMLKTPFYNGEFDEVTYWLHYYSFKAVSPFFNSVRVGN